MHSLAGMTCWRSNWRSRRRIGRRGRTDHVRTSTRAGTPRTEIEIEIESGSTPAGTGNEGRARTGAGVGAGAKGIPAGTVGGAAGPGIERGVTQGRGGVGMTAQRGGGLFHPFLRQGKRPAKPAKREEVFAATLDSLTMPLGTENCSEPQRTPLPPLGEITNQLSDTHWSC